MDFVTNILVGKRMRGLRLGSGLTQQEVADRYQGGQSVVSKLETGERSLRFCELEAYATALGLDDPLNLYLEVARVVVEFGEMP